MSVLAQGSSSSAAVTLSPTSLTFPTQLISSTSAGMNVTLTNTGNATLTISSISVTGTHSAEYAQTTTCSTVTPLPAGGTCTISVTFRPTAIGARSANLNVIDNGGGSPQLVPVSGTGN